MKERKADLRELHQVGTYLGVEDKAAHQLASAIHYAESKHCVISWSAQERAMEYFNTHGLGATLDEMFRLEGLAL
jgi:hypothetical protein